MKIEFPTSASELGHIFRRAEGHVLDSPEHRELMLAVANDEGARLQSDKYGNVWAARDLPDSRQVWIRIRGNKIADAGINAVPKTFNPKTGMNRP